MTTTTTIALVKENAVLNVLDNEGYEYRNSKIPSRVNVQVESEYDAYQLGVLVGKEKYSEKPEEFHLSNRCVPFLMQAIEEYSTESGVAVDTIVIVKGEHSSKIVIHPTKGFILFNIYSRYGKLLAAL